MAITSSDDARRLEFTDEKGEYILWAEIPREKNGTFNRAFGPFNSRSQAYSAKNSLIKRFEVSMIEQYFFPEEINKQIDGIKWTTTRLWNKVKK